MRLPLALFAAAVILPAPVHAQAAYETLADAIASAMEGNPSLAAQRQTRGVATEALEQARGAARPSVGLRGGYVFENVEVGQQFTIGGMTFPQDGDTRRATVGLEARQTLYAGGSLTALRRQAEAGDRAAGAQLRAFEQQVILGVMSAFTDVLRAEETVRIREANVAALDEHARAASSRFEVGEVTRTDVAQAQSRKAGADAALAAARAQREAARAGFTQLVGRPAYQLAPPPPAPQLPGSLEEAVGLAMAANPQLAAAREAETAAAEAVKVARGSLRPNIGIVGSAGMQEMYNDNSFRDSSVSVAAELTIPLYSGGVLSSRTRSAELQSGQARYERLAAERAITAQATSAWHFYLSAVEAAAASRVRVGAAEIALEGTKQELAVGTRITLDVLDQEQELLEARLGLIEAERNAYLAANELLAIIGRLTPDTAGR